MSKTTGFTYTGITSASQDKVSVRELQKEQKAKAQREVEPFAPAIVELINKEKAGLGLMLAGLVETNQSAREVQVHIEAVKLHRDYLVRFEAQVLNILRRERKGSIKADNE